MYVVVNSFVGQWSSCGRVYGIDIDGSASKERRSVASIWSVGCSEGSIKGLKSGYTGAPVDVELHKYTANDKDKLKMITDVCPWCKWLKLN